MTHLNEGFSTVIYAREMMQMNVIFSATFRTFSAKYLLKKPEIDKK
jgi:hypothetical protein